MGSLFMIIDLLDLFSFVQCGGMKVKRQGFILLSFSPSVGERKYDWQRKQVNITCSACLMNI